MLSPLIFRSTCIAATLCAATALAAPCDSLLQLPLKQSKITLATEVAAGAFVPPQGNANPYKNLPAFCRVAVTLTPTPDSDIKIEVWLPNAANTGSAAWNKEIEAVGNGAWAGTIGYAAMAGALASGYATASTDTGHAGNAVDFAWGHPEKVTDFAWRSIHEMTVAAKDIVKAYYGADARHSIFNGCSTGGRQALTEAERFPTDFDGIIAGAPAIWASHLQGMQNWAYQSANANPAAAMTREKYQALHNLVLQTCDAADGVKDGIIDNPRECQLDFSEIVCKVADGPTCLTEAQIEFVRNMYFGPTNKGKPMFSGLEKGSELGWNMIADKKPMSFAEEIYQLSMNDKTWTAAKLDWSHDLPKVEKALGSSMDSNNPNLKPFFDRGGKLIMYHGWADPGIAPGNTVRYFGEVKKTVGDAKAEAGMRLYMVPGMGHCRGGGTDTFDAPSALTRWINEGSAPSSLTASRIVNGKTDRTRPLCPYPQLAVYSGKGSTDDAANFSCKAP